MKKVYLTYADKKFEKQKRFALTAANFCGNFDKIIGLNPSHIDKDFFEKYNQILTQKRGAGYFLWKPYIINRTLLQMEYGDYLFYSDSGAFFLKRVDILIAELNKYDQDIMGFELPLIEEQWTKKELFINMGCNENKYYESNQIFASFILIKKTHNSEMFFQEYLDYSCNEINITDKHDESVQQSEIFIEHRHDQSIFSLLYKKYKLRPFKDPSQLGKYPTGYSGGLVNDENIIEGELKLLEDGRQFRINKYKEKYSMVLYLNKNLSPLKSVLKYYIKDVLFRFKIYKGIVR